MENFKTKPTPIVYFVKIALVAIILSLVTSTIGDLIGRDLMVVIFGIWGIAIIMAIAAFIIVHFREVEMTEHDIILKKGVLSTRRIIAPYSQVTNVNMHRGIVDRILGVGTLEVDTSGTDRVEVRMQYIKGKDLDKILEEFRQKKIRVSK